MKIHVVMSDNTKDEFTEKEIEERIEEGVFSGRELAWHVGMKDWQSLNSLDRFHSFFSDVDDPPPIPDANIDNNNKFFEKQNEQSENIFTTKDQIQNHFKTGCLGFFGTILMWLIPIFTTIQLLSSYGQIISTPGIESIGDLDLSLQVWIMAEVGLNMFLIVYGILVAKKIKNMVATAYTDIKKYLVLRLVLSIGYTILFGMYLAFVFPEDTAVLDSSLPVVFHQLVFFGVWFSYFKLSSNIKSYFEALRKFDESHSCN